MQSAWQRVLHEASDELPAFDAASKTWTGTRRRVAVRHRVVIVASIVQLVRSFRSSDNPGRPRCCFSTLDLIGDSWVHRLVDVALMRHELLGGVPSDSVEAVPVLIRAFQFRSAGRVPPAQSSEIGFESMLSVRGIMRVD